MSQQASSQIGIWQTIWAALTLDSQLYDDSQSNQKTRRTAFAIVFLAALSRALGGVVISLLNRVTSTGLFITFFLDIFTVMVSYYFWTFTIWKLGQWLKLNPPTYRHLLYPIGFAYSPQVLNVITLVPLLGRPIELILAMWTFLAVTMAIRKAMSITTLKAALISLVSFPIIQIVLNVLQVVAQQLAD